MGFCKGAQRWEGLEVVNTGLKGVGRGRLRPQLCERATVVTFNVGGAPVMEWNSFRVGHVWVQNKLS